MTRITPMRFAAMNRAITHITQEIHRSPVFVQKKAPKMARVFLLFSAGYTRSKIAETCGLPFETVKDIIRFRRGEKVIKKAVERGVIKREDVVRIMLGIPRPDDDHDYLI